MSDALIRKLECYEPLSDDDRRWLLSVTKRVRVVGPHQDLVQEGHNPSDVQVIVEGFAVRYKITREGRRQIFAYLIAGDFCDLHVAILKSMDHSIGTVATCRVATLPPEAVSEITVNRPALARSLWWCSLVDEGTLREWIVNMGQRRPAQRIAHMICELNVRMRVVNLTNSDTFIFPLTQAEIGDSMGLSTVHVNRSLKELRQAGYVSIRDQKIVIPDIQRLIEFAAFDPAYLHLKAQRIVA